MHPAVVRVIVPIRGGTSLGSGVLVQNSDKHGLIVTNHHVVRGATGTIKIVFPDGFQTAGQLLKTDKDWDLAAIAVWRPEAEPVKISRVPPKPGEWLTIAGYGSGIYRMQTGRCTKYFAPSRGLPEELVELSAAARQGDSGGPIFNQQGELAGVLFGEGGGRTIGSYGGRVHWFLADVFPQLDPTYGRDTGEMIAQHNKPNAAAPSAAARPEPAPRIVAPASEDWLAARPATPEPRKWPQLPSIQENDPAPVAAAIDAAKADEAAAGSGELARSFAGEPRKPTSPTEWRTAEAPQAEPTEAVVSTAQLVSWEELAGQTRWQQAKSILATIGLLVVLVQVLRVFGFFRTANA